MRARPGGQALPLLGVLFGVWSIVPPYVDVFGELNVSDRVEVVDHVVPGLVVIAIGVVGLLSLRAARPAPLLLFIGGAVVSLAGFWMVATHFGLVSQARQHVVAAGTVAWHGLPGVAVTLLGVAWTIRFWETEPGRGDQGAPRSRPPHP